MESLPASVRQANRASDPETEMVEVRISHDIVGADLWLNGVYVGKTPYRALYSEIMDRVPLLEKEPSESPEPIRASNKLAQRPIALVYACCSASDASPRSRPCFTSRAAS